MPKNEDYFATSNMVRRRNMGVNRTITEATKSLRAELVRALDENTALRAEIVRMRARMEKA
jgi:regulator of replication initiation timing